MMRSMTFISHRIGGQLRDEVRRPALHRMRLERRMRRGGRAVGMARLLDAAAQELRILRLADDDLGVRHLLGEHARDALQRAAGAVAGHPVVELLALEVRRRSRARWCASACRHWPRSRTGGSGTSRASSASSTALVTMATARPAAGVSTTLAPRKRIELAPLDAELLRHRHHQRIALLRRTPWRARCRCCRWSPRSRSVPA